MTLTFRQLPVDAGAIRRLVEDAMLRVAEANGHAGILAKFARDDMDRRSAADIRERHDAAQTLLNEARLILLGEMAEPAPTGAEIAEVGRAMAFLGHAHHRLDAQGDQGSEP